MKQRGRGVIRVPVVVQRLYADPQLIRSAPYSRCRMACDECWTGILETLCDRVIHEVLMGSRTTGPRSRRCRIIIRSLEAGIMAEGSGGTCWVRKAPWRGRSSRAAIRLVTARSASARRCVTFGQGAEAPGCHLRGRARGRRRALSASSQHTTEAIRLDKEREGDHREDPAWSTNVRVTTLALWNGTITVQRPPRRSRHFAASGSNRLASGGAGCREPSRRSLGDHR